MCKLTVEVAVMALQGAEKRHRRALSALWLVADGFGLSEHGRQVELFSYFTSQRCGINSAF